MIQKRDFHELQPTFLSEPANQRTRKSYYVFRPVVADRNDKGKSFDDIYRQKRSEEATGEDDTRYL